VGEGPSYCPPPPRPLPYAEYVQTMEQEETSVTLRDRLLETLLRVFPLLRWGRAYRPKRDLKGDLLAGLSVGVVGIPQGMAYALLAGMSAISGLYTSTVPALVYALFGTSKELAYGPVALVALVVERGLSPLAEPGTAEYESKVYLTTLLVGVLFVLVGALRLGFVVHFFSKPVLSAFISGSALIIVSEQCKHLLGVSFPRQTQFYGTLRQLLVHLVDTHLPTLAVAAGTLALLFLCKKLKRRLPFLEGPAILVTLGIVCAWFFDWEGTGIKLVGPIPSGLPALNLPLPSSDGGFSVPQMLDMYLQSILEIFPAALALVLVSYMTSVSIASKAADMKKYEIDPTQELIALGLANTVASFFSSFSGGGSLSRTMVNVQAGANSPLASVVAAVLILIVILFFTSVFYYLPYVVLGCIVIMAVLPLIEYQEFLKLWKLKRREAVLWIITVLATLLFGTINGIVIAVIFSMALVIYSSSHPNIDILGRLPGSTNYRNVNRFPQALVIPTMVVLRLDAALYFANVGFLKDKIRIEERKKIDPLAWPANSDLEEGANRLRGVVVLDWSSINDLDYTACTEIEGIAKYLKEKNILFLQAALKGPVRDTMLGAGLVQLIGQENFYWSVHDAVIHGQSMLVAAYGDRYALTTASGRAGSEEDSEGESEGQEHETHEQGPHAAWPEELELDSMMPRRGKKQDEEDKNYSPHIFHTSPSGS